uniref:Uncharacterized protein n=1 Tax=Oryza rufipogon TaxID=4529 RepID=A0A0E0QN64_ORYRU
MKGMVVMEREVRVTLRGDRLGQVPRCEARPEPRDPRRELLVRRRADGGLGLHHVRGHSCFFSSRYAIGAEATEAAREAAGGGGEECHGGRARLLRPRRFWNVPDTSSNTEVELSAHRPSNTTRSASVLFVLRKLPTKRGITQHHPTLGQSGSPQYVISNCSATLCEQKCRLSDTDEP